MAIKLADSPEIIHIKAAAFHRQKERQNCLVVLNFVTSLTLERRLWKDQQSPTSAVSEKFKVQSDILNLVHSLFWVKIDN